jgi:hypothetical protein
MKYLTDSEILKWNDRLEKSNFRLMPRYNTRNGHPDISINFVTNHFPGASEIKETLDPVIDYEFSFSVIKNRKDEFCILVKKMFNYKFETQLSFDDKSKSIDVFKEEDILKTEIQHSVLNREFIKYTYKFKGKLSSIIAYISYLEDAINFFQLLWGYNEEGEEICLTKYKIGDIVSFKDDKSKDYLIIDYLYTKLGKDYSVDYYVSEMIIDNNTCIIKYGDSLKASESQITWSRDSRINDILN